jgi:hypothetical protein
MAWKPVRKGSKLLFKYDPDRDMIEIIVNRKPVLIKLDDYRSLQHRRTPYELPPTFVAMSIKDED